MYCELNSKLIKNIYAVNKLRVNDMRFTPVYTLENIIFFKI